MLLSIIGPFGIALILLVPKVVEEVTVVAKAAGNPGGVSGSAIMALKPISAETVMPTCFERAAFATCKSVVASSFETPAVIGSAEATAMVTAATTMAAVVCRGRHCHQR